MIELDPSIPPIDYIVEGEGDKVKAELDIRNNDRVRVGDQRIATLDDNSRIVLVVTGFEYATKYDNMAARRTAAMREGAVGEPETRTAKEVYQRKLAIMRVEGEIRTDGKIVRGALRLPEKMSPAEPMPEELLEQFTVDPEGDVVLGNLSLNSRTIGRAARISHNFAGDRMVIFGMPGKGKSQKVRELLGQLLGADHKIGILVLDRAGEYVEDTEDQKGNKVFGFQHHPNAPDRMVVVSRRAQFKESAEKGAIAGHLVPQFNIRDIEPIDLIDWYRGFTKVQQDLLRDYAYVLDLYEKLLQETRFGMVDKRDWYQHFPGLFEIDDKGRKLLREFEEAAANEDRYQLEPHELDSLEGHLKGFKKDVLERAIQGIKRFAGNPYFGGHHRAPAILNAPSCVDEVLADLRDGKAVFIDLRGVEDDDYTLISAIFARKLLTHNKRVPDSDQIRACMVMEEAHNILAEAELYKGYGNGSVFVELAREGRKLKLGFVLVTQQPDPQRSLASEIANTIDVIIAFNMPPENARYLARLNSGFSGRELWLANAAEFEGIAVAGGGALAFTSRPVGPPYMTA
ncbi:MAG: DUF87 domain-containing protein, partial [Bacillota bacterium]|nr:DUF87 domain-containing protein [Bacillota bacterium]